MFKNHVSIEIFFLVLHVKSRKQLFGRHGVVKSHDIGSLRSSDAELGLCLSLRAASGSSGGFLIRSTRPTRRLQICIAFY